MFKFSDKSEKIIDSCDNRIQMAIHRAMSWQIMDMVAIYGHRDRGLQFDLYKKGRIEKNGFWVVEDKTKIVTNIDGFNQVSYHNYDPSLAIDIAPYISGRPIFGNTEMEVKQVLCLAGIIQGAFSQLEIKYTWGGNWDNDGEPLSDQIFNDLLHFQVPINET